MGTSQLINNVLAPETDVVGDAVGFADRKWFVAIVNHNTEKAVERNLQELNYETYVAKQTVTRIWKNGRRTNVSKVVIPSLVFIKCSEVERREIVNLPFIKRFLVNISGKSKTGHSKPLAVIPQYEIDQLRYMLGQSEISIAFVDTPMKLNSKVVVTRGGLKGIRGVVIRETEGRSEVLVKIDLLGAAKMSIATSDIELIKR